MKSKAKYEDAFQSIVNDLRPNTGKNTPNSPNPTKGGISISKELIPDDVVEGDVILLKVASVDLDKNEVHLEYVSKQEKSSEKAEATAPETEVTAPKTL